LLYGTSPEERWNSVINNPELMEDKWEDEAM
jgi:hypothetical protein